jgi:hypothetical protein
MTDFRYNFQWKDGAGASIMTLLIAVETGVDDAGPKRVIDWDLSPSIIVRRARTDNPEVQMGRIPLVHLPAIVEEIVAHVSALKGEGETNGT